jgi:hypothetical protein
VTAVVNANSRWRPVAGYAVGVWVGLTAWAALAKYVLPGRGHALGKLGSFYWVFVINLLPALLCASGFVVGMVVMQTRAPAGVPGWRVALLLGLLFPLTALLLKPLFAQISHGLGPALVWCVVGSAIAAGLLRWWKRRETPT